MIDHNIIKERQEKLIGLISNIYPEHKEGIIIIFSGFEQERIRFRPDSSFYYLSEISDPTVLFVIDLEKRSTGCFVPNLGNERKKWMGHSLMSDNDNPQDYGLDFIKFLGKSCKGYQCPQYFSCDDYANVIEYIKNVLAEDRSIFALYPHTMQKYTEQRFILQRLQEFIPDILNNIIDISPLLARLRRKKSKQEIEKIYRAIELTIAAQECVAQELKPGLKEYELQALIEYIFTSNGAQVAFPSIVASGHASTTLHYHACNQELKKGDLVVVDIGAEYQMYCADLTRTYPISKTFTKRQRHIYDLVLQAQEYIAGVAQPGYWISNKEQPDKSLQHLTVEFFKKHGVHEYFWHGVSHFLGLDVHDVGSVSEPLEDGDVITIEPGLYFPDEQIGVRIEDDYWITQKGAICLSESLEKTPERIEKMMKEQ